VRAITKGAEPNSLLQHRMQQHSHYDNYAQKDDLRAALASEQKGLCCYCMGRIRANERSMKIEHWQSQRHHQHRQLAYPNLLGACRGGEGQPASDQHCDTRKADRDLKWNPADAAHSIETRISYLLDGRIESSDAEFDEQLNSVLGLNHPFLRNGRKAALDAMLDWWRTTPKARRKIPAQLRRIAEQQELVPFSPVAVGFLSQKLGGAAV
jgi:uncharacterized protein (TIGR02646 family)